jgi:hypothetical protein
MACGAPRRFNVQRYVGIKGVGSRVLRSMELEKKFLGNLLGMKYIGIHGAKLMLRILSASTAVKILTMENIPASAC